MEAYQQRVIDEKVALDEKLAKLTEFVGSAAYEVLDNVDRFLLCRQRDAMVDYSRILEQRIERFAASSEIG